MNAFITGEAGTGKSEVAKAIIFFCQDILPLNVLVMGSTGVAASNLDGFTVHACQKLNQYSEAIRGSQTTEYAKWIKDYDVIICDEFPVMTVHDVLKLEEQLKNHAVTKDNQSRPWGGYNMIMVGDHHQLTVNTMSSSAVDLVEGLAGDRNYSHQLDGLHSLMDATWYVL